MSEDLIEKLLKVNNRKEKLCKEQIQSLRDFDDYIRAKNPIKALTRLNQMSNMMKIAEEIKKPFENVSRKEMEKFIAKLEKRYSLATMEQRKTIIKKFWRWLGKPEVVDWIKLEPSNYRIDIDPKECWTYEDVKKLTRAFSHIQHQALSFVIFESEGRISEVLSMNICDVEEQGNNFKLWFRKSKTRTRNVGICHSVIYLKKWLDQHPYQNDPNHALWISLSARSKGNRLKPCSVGEMLHNAQKRSGVNKKLTPHRLRHSFCSYLVRKGYSNYSHSIRMGLKPNSRTIENYTHVSDDNANDDYLKIQGVEVPDEKPEENVFESIRCWKCGTENLPTADYCCKCSENITVETAEKDFNLLQMLKSNFVQFKGVDIDKLLGEYQQFKDEKQDMQKMLQRVLDCFNGGTVIQTQILRKKLCLDDSDALVLLGYLIASDLIEIKENTVKINSREDFEKFIPKHEHSPSIVT